MRLSSSLFIYSLQVLAATSLVSKAAAFAEDRDPVQFGQTKGAQVGDVYEVFISSADIDESEIKPVTSDDGKSDTYTLTYTDASYISVHFSEFNLPLSCLLDITDDQGKQAYTLKAKGKLDLGTFWAHHVTGDTMKLSLSCEKEEEKKIALFEIDQFAAGFPVTSQPKVDPTKRHLRSRDDNIPSFLKSIDEQRKLSICGSDDKRNAICYKDSEPTIYNKAKAVARLLINGRYACTGWLVSETNLLFTNEHCIDSLSDVQNTDFEFMGEESKCAIGSSDGSWFSSRNKDGIYDGTDLLKVSSTWDYALIQLSGNPASTYGFLELDNRKASIDEEIYIPQHPGGRPKEIGVFDSNHNGNCKVKKYSAGCSPEDMRYSCDTEGGSSGSPVLSRTNNKVVALHHCGGGCNGNLGAPIYKFYDEIEEFVPAKKLFLGTDYTAQQGTNHSPGYTTVGWFDDEDYLTYGSVYFGPTGTTTGIRINYAKHNHGGSVEVRLGSGTTGQLIGEFTPASTRSWSKYMTAYFDIEDVSGTHDITFVGKDVHGVLNLAWFELGNFSERSDVDSRIPASEYADQKTVQFLETGHSTPFNYAMGWFDNGDFITYANVNFGVIGGAKKSIKVRYAKGNSGGTVIVKLGGADGTQIGQFTPNKTGGWHSWVTDTITLDVDVDGIHDLTFVGTGKSGVMNLEWFELAA